MNSNKNKKLVKKIFTAMQTAFINAYVVENNGAKAAIIAGINPKTARTRASEWLTNRNIKSEIQRIQKENAQAAGLRAEAVLVELMKIAFLNPKRLFNNFGDLLPIENMPDEVACAISGFEVVPRYDKGTKETTLVTKVKFWNKNAALEYLGTYLGMVKGKGADAGEINNNITCADIIAKAAEYEKNKKEQ